MEGLERFLKAQDSFRVYEIALGEIRQGRKQSHWIWFVFPQLKGLGRSFNSEYYGLDGLEEARSFLAHPVLGQRLRKVTEAALRHQEEDPVTLMGSRIDAVKLKSCMTLFDIVSPNDIFREVLKAFYDDKRCRRTLSRLSEND